MLIVRPLAEENYEECLALMRAEMEQTIEPTLAVMGLDWPQFARLFHETGEVYGVYAYESARETAREAARETAERTGAAAAPAPRLPGTQADALAGFYWIETRGTVLHVHALILKPTFQGRGIGSQVIAGLAEAHPAGVDTIELGVHEANPRARALYERLGFRLVKELPEVGFAILQKPL